MSREAFVTLVTNDNYAVGAVVLAESLYRSKTNKELVVLITNGVNLHVRQLLADVFDHVYITSELCSHDDVALSLLGRPELAITYTKLHCWRLTQYQKCVYLDADTLVLHNCDELFDREELSAVPDTGWPDCFNSGVFVFRPSLDTYAKLVSLAHTKGSFDGGDQGLLNTYFGTWRSDISRRLPFIYNMVSNVSYTYAPAYLHYASGVKIVHFLGSDKPWFVRWRTDNGAVDLGEHQSWELHIPFLQTWTGIFREKVLPKLSEAAKNYVHKSTWMTVDQLFYRIISGDINKYVERSRTADEPVVETHFPSHTFSHPFEKAVPGPPVIAWQSSAVPESTPPPVSSSLQSEPSLKSSPEPTHHVYIDPPRHSLSTSHSESEHQKSVAKEPADPHWEALLWHSIQSPWEPPLPPSSEDYQLPPSQQYQEPCDENLTFGWFSADSGAQSPTAAQSEAHFTEPEREPSQKSLPQDTTESSVGTEDQEEDSATTSGTSGFTRMRHWEEGNIDYLGKDKFENILKKLELMFTTTPDAKTELEDFKESLKDSLAQSTSNQAGSINTSSLLDEDDVATLVPDSPSEVEESWHGYPEGDYSGMVEWQEGRVDYCGRDRSDNIMRRLDLIISGGIVEDF